MTTRTLAAPMAVRISRPHIVAIGALGCLTFGWVFSGKHLLAATAFAAIDWFVVNLLNRAVDLEEDRRNKIAGTGFVARHRAQLLALGIGALVASFAASLALLPLALSGFRVAFHTLGFSYNWRLLPGGRRIKELYFFKNAASATGFVLTCFAYPLAQLGWLDANPPFAAGVSWLTVSCALLFFFPFEISYEILYDLRDIEGDRAERVKTFPVVHGPRTAGVIIDVLLGLSCAALIGGYLAGIAPWRLGVMVVAPLSQLALFHTARAKGRIDSRFCTGITWLGAGMLLAYHLWVLFKLPGVGA